MCGLALFCCSIFVVVVVSFVFYVLYVCCLSNCTVLEDAGIRTQDCCDFQMHTVFVRTFVIPFYRGSGSGSDPEP